MRHLKRLSLTAIAAAALMAFVGAGDASATVICKTEPTKGGTETQGTTCPTGLAYGKETVMHAVNSGTVKLETAFKNIECSGSTIQGVTQNEGGAGEPVNVNIEVLTFTGCNCEVKVLKGGTQEIKWRADTFNSPIIASGQEVTASCSTIFGTEHCIYGTSKTELGEITGGSPAISHVAAEVPRFETAFQCEELAHWTATYKFTSPEPMFFADHT